MYAPRDIENKSAVYAKHIHHSIGLKHPKTLPFLAISITLKKCFRDLNKYKFIFPNHCLVASRQMRNVQQSLMSRSIASGPGFCQFKTGTSRVVKRQSQYATKVLQDTLCSIRNTFDATAIES